MRQTPLLFLGVGQVARAVAHRARGGRALIGTTRTAENERSLRALGIEPLFLSSDTLPEVERAAKDAWVLVSFPPDPANDRALAAACRDADRTIYLSSTAVYGTIEGRIDDATAIDGATPEARARLQAEETWLAAGAIVLRAPGLYGPQSGLHIRLLNGSFRIPGDGSRYVSRIHLTDLATIILACFERPLSRRTYVVGDLKPATHAETVGWLCRRLRLPAPPSEPLASAHYTLRTNRLIDPRKLLSELGVTLEYPTYKEGFEACLSARAGDDEQAP